MSEWEALKELSRCVSAAGLILLVLPGTRRRVSFLAVNLCLCLTACMYSLECGCSLWTDCRRRAYRLWHVFTVSPYMQPRPGYFSIQACFWDTSEAFLPLSHTSGFGVGMEMSVRWLKISKWLLEGFRTQIFALMTWVLRRLFIDILSVRSVINKTPLHQQPDRSMKTNISFGLISQRGETAFMFILVSWTCCIEYWGILLILSSILTCSPFPLALW